MHARRAADYDPAWMARVTEVVMYARNAGLYVVLNLHHEGSWLDNVTYDKQAANNARLAKLWTQIANNFKSDDDYLLFAGHNEVGKENAPWGVPPQKEWTDVQNGYHQAFVNAVRATGGNNAQRSVMPTDTIANRLFMEFHYYGPWNFATTPTTSSACSTARPAPSTFLTWSAPSSTAPSDRSDAEDPRDGGWESKELGC